MKFHETALRDAYTIELDQLADDRGFFARALCLEEFAAYGIDFTVVQMNVSYNKARRTLRGLHYQTEPHEEAKLVRCTKGSIFDVIIDLRGDSSTYMKWFGTELTDRNYRALYVPEGFAHGFITLKDETEVNYMVSEYYTPGAEKGIRWDDPAFRIAWPVEPSILSDKDANWPDFVPGRGAA